ncbi:MAG TPA: effector-associated domain EAD1-containing protein [Microlunatus sp.]|nr:effector-associated domain EAD1-containing protein [Microlunatus sp.]
MGFFDRVAIGTDDPDRCELTLLLRGAYADKRGIGVLIERIGLRGDEVNWDRSVAEIWDDVFDRLASRGLVRRLVEEAIVDPGAAGARRALEQFSQRVGAVADPGAPLDHTAVQIIRGWPFVDRADFRALVRSLASDDLLDGPVVVVSGERGSGRSYTWNLISHVGQRSRRFTARLFDLSAWADLASVGPLDVARDMGDQLRWQLGDFDPTLQPDTQARLVLSRFKGWVADYPGQLWLVFDGLDDPALPDAALRLVASFAAAAENGELSDVRVVLVGLDRPVHEVDFDPSLSRQVMSDVPLAELCEYLVNIAAGAGLALDHDQAHTLLVSHLGDPPPDPVPVRRLDAPFVRLVRKLAAGGRRG